LLLAQGAVGREWAKFNNLAVTGRSTTHDARRTTDGGTRPKGVVGTFCVERPVRTCKRSLAKQGLKSEPRR
jgi:hypothetical protein